MASESIYKARNFSLIPFLEVVTPIPTFATPIARVGWSEGDDAAHRSHAVRWWLLRPQ